MSRRDSEPSETRAESEARTEDEAARWRVFFAVELPRSVRESAGEHLSHLRARAPQVRASWERPEKMHVTLKFVGEVALQRIEELKRAAGEAVADVSPFELKIEGTGAFPPRGEPRVLWLGVTDASGELSRLQARLEEACAREGFKREQRAYRPHLTVARLRSPTGTRTLAALHRESAFETEPFTVSELVLVRSQLSPAGSVYTTVSRHALNAVA
ncbi:MAG TPA: RNA 2',3'-cyclic phosphodiesterase [Pyrinomonadaceae bacterium]|nr:RNA 2',3'-cyclic phosphodiesterase [Pyrinomonadaceae bacterium]